MKIDQSAFIKDLVIEKGLNDYNSSIIPIKARSSIEMLDIDDYKETDLYKYQRLIGKLMYLAYGIRPNIVFLIGQLSKQNADPRKE